MSGKEPPVTLRFIAREAGVSVATASRTLRQPNLVSPETRTRVLSAVERHGYVPDQVAASFSSGRTGLVGLIVPTISNSIYAAFTEAVQTRLSESGRKLLIASSGYVADQEGEILLKLVENRVDGVILTGFRRERRVYDMLRRYGISFVVSWSTSGDPEIPAISFDNYAAATQATEYLLGLGHRRIGLMCGVVELNDRAEQRLAAFRDALGRCGIAPDPSLIAERPFEAVEGARVIEAWAARGSMPTAVFCANDILALGALFAAQRLGLRAPRDLSIVGFDDLPIASVTSPALTTVHVPAVRMGVAAAEALVAQMDEGEAIRSLTLPAELAIRESTGPPGLE